MNPQINWGFTQLKGRNFGLTICPATSALTIAGNHANAQFASHPDETASGTEALPAALVAELSFAPNDATVADAEQAAGVRKRDPLFGRG